MSLIRFTVSSVLLGLLLMAGLGLSIRNGLTHVPALSLPLVLFNLVLTALSYWWVGASRQPFIFGQRYLLTVVVRMLLQLTVIVACSLAYPGSMVATSLFALICHAAYLLLEVSVLYNKAQG